MELDALIPDDDTPPTILPLARAILEAGALLSIRAQDGAAFTRYYQQLQPFYALPASEFEPESSHGEHQRSKITGLYLLQLLTKGDYAGFHTLLEGLEAEIAESLADEGRGVVPGIENDRFIRYPVELEQALMEGAYDRVWKSTKGEGVPSEEFSVFSEVSCFGLSTACLTCADPHWHHPRRNRLLQ
jgi:26S proteasome regulatory subunit N12